MNSPIPTKGAYFLMRACRLIFRAALRYFADSERSEVDKCDIPSWSTEHRLWADGRPTIQTISSP
jgi:hypothetical protein